MDKFYLSDAQALVRRNLDELDPNGSIMFDDENGSSSEHGDNASLDDIIARLVPEAINEVNKAAPVSSLEGTDVKSAATWAAVTGDTKVLTITFGSNINYLRLVAFKAADSDIVVTDTIQEASPEGRKQHNMKIRGRADRPRLVIMQGTQDGSPEFRYYSFKAATATPVSANVTTFIVLKEVRYEDTNAGYHEASGNDSAYYDCCQKLRQNYVDYLTARVLETYGDQRSQIYMQRANNFIG